MANSNFDQPTLGDVNSAKPALEVKNAGSGPGVKVTATQDDAIQARALGALGMRVVGESGGVQASSRTGYGVYGHSRDSVGVYGDSARGDGVHGLTKGANGSSGVAGESFEPGSVAVSAASDRGIGLLASSKEDVGVSAQSDLDNGIVGRAGVSGKAGVWGINIGAGGIGVVGLSQVDIDHPGKGEPNMSIGVLGQAKYGTGVQGIAEQGDGVVGETSSDANSGVIGRNGAAHGRAISGLGDQGTGVYASSSSWDDPAILAENDAGGTAIRARTSGPEPRSAVNGRNEKDGFGIVGFSSDGTGIVGLAADEGGWIATSLLGQPGVAGVSLTRPGIGAFGGTDQPGVVAWGDPGLQAFGGISAWAGGNLVAGSFLGNVTILGKLQVTGVKAFRIDHPLAPSTRYLNHAAVESSELKTIYDGVVKLGRDGRATVRLPKWFAAVNGDLRYQLTPIGGPAPDLHVARPSNGRTLEIAGGRAGMQVSWQVTGVRRDASAVASAFKVEEPKSKAESGTYLEPELFGQPRAKALRPASTPDGLDVEAVRAKTFKAARRAASRPMDGSASRGRRSKPAG